MSVQGSKRIAGLPSEAVIEYGEGAPDFAGAVRGVLHEKGFVVVTGLPQKPAVPDGRLQVSRAFRELASAIGQPQIYPGEGGDGTVSEIRPDKNTLPNEVSYKSCNEFDLHTDMTYIENPPQYMGLFVVRPDKQRKAANYLAHVDDAVRGLSSQIRDALLEPDFHFRRPSRAGDMLSCEFDESACFPILEESSEGYNARFRMGTTIALNSKAIAALWEFSRQLESVKMSLQPDSNTAIFLDNRKVLHARSAFTPTYDENDRCIHRVYLEV